MAALEALEGQADAVGWRLGRVVHGDRDGVGDPLGGVVREERRDVTVGTHAEEHDVPGLLAVLPDRPGVRLGAGLGALGRVGPATRCTFAGSSPSALRPASSFWVSFRSGSPAGR